MARPATDARAATRFSTAAFCLFCGLAMAYGWGWRGNYGHGAGAMLPGALVAMAACLGSVRQDWYRRCAVAGLFGAFGWSIGGSLSNMEHTFYVMSSSVPDVAYGFACIGLIGALWAGVGGAILSLVFTRPRSELQRFVGPLTAVASVWFLLFIFSMFNREQSAAAYRFSQQHLPPGDWFSPLIALVVSGIYWLIHRRDRPAAGLFFTCAAAWWIGFLALPTFGSIRLAPPYRAETWAGLLGILIALLVHLFRQKNRAGVMLTLYATLAGCIGFILAVFVFVPICAGWGPFPTIAPWKTAEESFGLFMGIGVALGIARLRRGGLAAPAEDAERALLDLFAAFVLLIPMMWMNLRKNVRDWGPYRYDILPEETMYGLSAPQWFFIVGVLWTLLVLYCFVQYRRGRLMLIPQTAFEKGSLLFIVVVLVSLVGAACHRFPDWQLRGNVVFPEASYCILVLTILWLLLARSTEGRLAGEPPGPGVPVEDPTWTVGWRYWILWTCVPVIIAIVTALSLAVVEQGHSRGRKRFGPDAYWRQQLEETKR